MFKVNKAKTIVLAFAGSLLSLAALLIFNLLPSSQLANGVEHAATDAIWVLAASPVLFLLGGMVFMSAYLKDFKAWKDFLSGAMVKGATGLFAIACIYNVVVSLMYFLSQYKLGFVAPFDGTVYGDVLVIIMTVVTIAQFIFSILGTAAVLRNSK